MFEVTSLQFWRQHLQPLVNFERITARKTQILVVKELFDSFALRLMRKEKYKLLKFFSLSNLFLYLSSSFCLSVFFLNRSFSSFLVLSVYLLTFFFLVSFFLSSFINPRISSARFLKMLSGKIKPNEEKDHYKPRKDDSSCPPSG